MSVTRFHSPSLHRNGVPLIRICCPGFIIYASTPPHTHFHVCWSTSFILESSPPFWPSRSFSFIGHPEKSSGHLISITCTTTHANSGNFHQRHQSRGTSPLHSSQNWFFPQSNPGFVIYAPKNPHIPFFTFVRPFPFILEFLPPFWPPCSSSSLGHPEKKQCAFDQYNIYYNICEFGQLSLETQIP